jgi:cell division protein FtsL
MAGVVVILGLAYVFVWQRVHSLKLADEIALRQARVSALEERCRALELRVARLASMQRLERIAVEHLGLIPMDEKQITSYEGYLQHRRGDGDESAGGLQAAPLHTDGE